MESNSDKTAEIAEKQRAYEEWAKQHVKKIYNRLLKLNLVTMEARWEVVWALPNKILIGKIWEEDRPTTAYWIIGGEVPEDFVELSVAETPRDVARHFAMKWQLDGSRVAGLSPDSVETSSKAVRWDQVGGSFADKAEQLYDVVVRDEFWT